MVHTHFRNHIQPHITFTYMYVVLSGIVFNRHNAYCVNFPRVSATVKVTSYYYTTTAFPRSPQDYIPHTPHTPPYKALLQSAAHSSPYLLMKINSISFCGLYREDRPLVGSWEVWVFNHQHNIKLILDTTWSAASWMIDSPAGHMKAQLQQLAYFFIIVTSANKGMPHL